MGGQRRPYFRSAEGTAGSIGTRCRGTPFTRTVFEESAERTVVRTRCGAFVVCEAVRQRHGTPNRASQHRHAVSVARATPGAAACVRITEDTIQSPARCIYDHIAAALACVRATSAVLWAPLCGVHSAWRCLATRALPWPLIVCTSPRALAN